MRRKGEGEQEGTHKPVRKRKKEGKTTPKVPKKWSTLKLSERGGQLQAKPKERGKKGSPHPQPSASKHVFTAIRSVSGWSDSKNKNRRSLQGNAPTAPNDSRRKKRETLCCRHLPTDPGTSLSGAAVTLKKKTTEVARTTHQKTLPPEIEAAARAPSQITTTPPQTPSPRRARLGRQGITGKTT
jgi:hypothetical protein